jgi:ABC-type enterochelin transport system permease subunit
MPTKSYTLILYHLQDLKVQSWWKRVFSLWGTTKFWRPKIHFFWLYWIVGYILVPRLVIYMSTKSYSYKTFRTLRKNYFLPWGMLKFTNKGHFLTIKKAYKKLLYLKSKWQAHAMVLLLLIDFILFCVYEKHQNLKFWWYFKVSQAILFHSISVHLQMLLTPKTFLVVFGQTG